MNIDIGIVYILISIVGTLALFFYSWKLLPQSSYKRYFLWCTLLLTAYTNWKIVFHPDDMLSNYGIFDMWFRHLFFYAGQWSLLLFFGVFFEAVIANDQNIKPVFSYVKPASLALFFIVVPTALITLGFMNLNGVSLSVYNFIYFVTANGVQHILAMIFFFSTIAYVQTFALYPEYATIKNFLAFFVAANFMFIMLHLFEYTQETLHLFPFISDDTGENLEAVFQYGALILTAISAYKLSRTIKNV